MSRSTKRPWVKDRSKGLKQLSARMHRSKCRQVLLVYRKEYLDESDQYFQCMMYEDEAVLQEDPVFPDRRTLVNQWDICDWKMYRPEDPAYYRK